MISKKSFAVSLALVVAVGLLAGCGNGNTNSSSSSSPSAETNTAEAGNQEVSIFWSSSATANDNQMLDDFATKTGIKVNKVILSGTGDEQQQKINMMLVSGDKTDVMFMPNPVELAEQQEGGTLMPLNESATKVGYDAEKTFGKYLPKDKDGNYYGFPSGQTIWSIIYNKKIFDDAGVAYPKGNWTWDDYVKTAEKLTDTSKKIYGSYMLDYDNYNYILANQRKVSAYKEDGTSNYDDPAFKDSLQFFQDLGNKYKVQPSYEEFQTKKLPWDGFMQGTYGMTFISSWYLGLLSDTKTYPRDWKFGVAPTPANPDGQNNLVSSEYFGINKNAAHQAEAFELVKFIAENKYIYEHTLPAREDLSEEDWTALFAESAKGSGGDVTGEDLYNAFINNGLGIVDEKIGGSISKQYSNFIIKEGQKFYYGQESADDAVKNIKEQADKAIAQLK